MEFNPAKLTRNQRASRLTLHKDTYQMINYKDGSETWQKKCKICGKFKHEDTEFREFKNYARTYHSVTCLKCDQEKKQNKKLGWRGQDFQILKNGINFLKNKKQKEVKL